MRLINPIYRWLLTLSISFAFAIPTMATSFAQTITLKEHKASLKQVFIEIHAQAGIDFLAPSDVMSIALPVTIEVKNQPLIAVLDGIFESQPLKYKLSDNIVVVSKKDFHVVKQTTPENLPREIIGHVTDSVGKPLVGATIKNDHTGAATSTGQNGIFKIDAEPGDNLVISYLGYKSSFYKVADSQSEPYIVLYLAPSTLNDIVVIGYGTTTKRLSTGSVSSVSSSEIEKQPITNILSAIGGEMPGVFVQTANGLPGGGINVQIRGRGSIAAGTDPLYIIDGIPFSSNVIAANDPLGFSAINGAVSPLNSINPNDIENISVLKDADATAIYGSRGSNGVILITTKKGKAGKTKVEASLSTGVNQVADLPRLLNLDEYLNIRNQAFKNDGLNPSSDPNDIGYAPDLRSWDTTKATNWAKYLLGKTGHTSDFQTSVSGGNQHTNFFVGGNYHIESTVLPGENKYARGGIHANLQHISDNGRLTFQFSSSYTADHNQLSNLTTNFSADLLLPPDFPLYDPAGNYNYTFGYNPLADLSAISKTQTNNIVLNGNIKYKIFDGLNFKISGGYNKIEINQVMTYPTNSQYQGSTNYADFGNNSNQNIIIEPQLNYVKQLGTSSINFLAGGTYQKTTRQNQFIEASNFSNDLFLENISSATTFSVRNYTIDYKYLSVFTRINYNLNDKYLLNVTARRDGSSRFGPGNQYGNFGSIGGAWILSNERWWKQGLSFVSFGKIRANYGITGNDQISDYQYLATYQSSGYIYQNIAAIQPARLYNPDFHWETSHKLEFALELGLFKDRLSLDINRYQTRTSDQLVTFSTPRITGFSSYQANLPAEVENTGWELNILSKNISKTKFSWSTSLNLTIPSNKLISFQNLATSSYANLLVIGEPISRAVGYKFAGLNGNGAPLFATQNGAPSTSPSSTDAYYSLGKGYPDFYGGVTNTVSLGNVSLSVLGQFAKQSSMGGLIYTPGIIGNGFSNLMNYWRQPSDKTIIPQPSTNLSYYLPYSQSSANYYNTSYFRIKNVSLSYAFPATVLKKLKIEQLSIFFHGENLYTFWNRNVPVYDPETGAGTNIPPMKVYTIGLQASL